MKKLLLASSALICSTPAFAQAWTVGPQTAVYSTGQLGNGSGGQGGVAPAYSYMPAEPNDGINVADWTQTIANGRTVGAAEAKARFQCHVSHESQEDPILYPGQVRGHLHTFFGNTLAGKDSNYLSLRTTGYSTCGGNRLNGTAYWHPSLRKKLPSGVTVSLKAERITVYYTIGDPANSTLYSPIPRDFNYIAGMNPADIGNQRARNEIAAANTLAGFEKYSLRTDTVNGSGFHGWKCISTDITVPYLVNEDGEDMFVVTGGQACPSTSLIEARIMAPSCWDGVNLHSPDGRGHVRDFVRTGNNNGTSICPDGWYRVPKFEGIFLWSHNGPADYTTWYLSSDRMEPATTAPDPGSASPCRKVSAWFCPGESFHMDWWGGWKYGTGAAHGPMLQWMNRCPGVKIVLDGVTTEGAPADCVDNTINDTLKMIGNADSVPASCLADPACPKTGPTNSWQLWFGKPLYKDASPPSGRYFAPRPDVNDALQVHGSHGSGMAH